MWDNNYSLWNGYRLFIVLMSSKYLCLTKMQCSSIIISNNKIYTEFNILKLTWIV